MAASTRAPARRTVRTRFKQERRTPPLDLGRRPLTSEGRGTTLTKLWGVVGTILCLPIMVIIYGHFRPTQPIAILLSSDGEIELHTYRAEPAP
jgi:hypothetical protein